MYCHISYIDVFKQVNAIQELAKVEEKHSPSVAEMAAIIGDTEEHILESMEYGTNKSSCFLIH